VTHNLYRCFDANDDLLYVGISWSAPTRFSEHSRQAPWWPEVTTIRLEAFPDRREAEWAEFEAIKTERPRHNKIISRGFATTPEQRKEWGWESQTQRRAEL